MKITKKKEIITEEISVEIKDYYFDIDLVLYKVTFKDVNNYTVEILHNFLNSKAIRQRTYGQYDDINYDFEQYLLGERGREITKEEYDLEREDIIKELLKGRAK